MNKELALQTRADLRVIIEGYEKFLFGEITGGSRRVLAVEALATKDLVRSVGMSEVSRNRVDTILEKNKGEPRRPEDSADVNTQTDSSISTTEQALFPEVGRIASAAEPAIVTEGSKSNDSLFRNLEECIPCNQNWSWGDFDWERLKEILSFDIRTRFKWLLDIEDMFNENPVLDRLCGFLHSFKNLCPQSLLVLISMLVAYLTKTLDSIKFNFDGVLKDLLGMILRPYIGGLEDFLNAYIQFLVDQVDCILNLIQVSAQELRDLNIDIDIGRKTELTPEEVKTGNTSSFKYNQDIITGRGDVFFDDVAKGTKRTREFLRHDTKRYVHYVTDDIPTYIADIVRDSLDWVEAQVQRAQDAVIDILGGEWLVTGQNLTWMEQMRAVATVINILEVIYGLGDIDELCNEDNVVRVIDGINIVGPDRIVIPDSRFPDVNSAFDAGESNNGLPVGSNNGQPPSERGSLISSGVTVPFNLSSCLKKPGDVSEAQLRQWINELS